MPSLMTTRGGSLVLMAARTVLAATILCAVVSQPANAGPLVPVRPLYLVPTDRAPNTDYAAAIDAALLDLQTWFAGELGGLTFDIASSVGILSTSHPASYLFNDAASVSGNRLRFLFQRAG